MFVISMLPQYNTVQYSPRGNQTQCFMYLLRSNTKDIIILPTEWINGLSSTLYELSRGDFTFLEEKNFAKTKGFEENYRSC